MGLVKINVAVGVSVQHNVGTATATYRDRDGSYLGSLVLVIQGIADPATLEALACRESLSLAQDFSMHHLQIASDCKQVVNHIRQGVGGSYGSVIREILETARNFTSCNFVFEPRASNVDAHRLARFGVSLPQGRHLWLGSPHDPIAIPVNVGIDQ